MKGFHSPSAIQEIKITEISLPKSTHEAWAEESGLRVKHEYAKGFLIITIFDVVTGESCKATLIPHRTEQFNEFVIAKNLSKAASILARRGNSSRIKNVSPEKRSEMAKHAAETRWNKIKPNFK